MNEVYIEAKGASYSYKKGGFSLVPGDLSLRLGEIVFLSGKNGSGKSTWMQLLTGILKPAEGIVLLDGMDTRDLNLGQIGKKIGYVWQNPQVQLFADTVWDEMTFVDGLKKLSGEDSAQKAETWLCCFDLIDKKDASVFRLSGGEKQRLALAVTLSQGARYLMLDEPSKNLDGESIDRLAELLGMLRDRKGIGMLIVSHDDAFREKLADRVVEVQEGRIYESV